ncbi:DUF2138 domain-containing protein [Paraburkholderia antibiotica]|uniref:DUF2138 domain-containing protein n=1 Tax=Paraburkholderia antibiotica TaxID=2728839 RepID=A0A7Y0A1V5_9BURK|nr:DUF2138 domain-containing protein [Paraburkholderia antibiotica]NML34980.1 DUF2138 domain-containing protein [Paraburkholderia antibiotica]
MKMSRKKMAILSVGLLIVAGVIVQAVWRPFGHRKAVENGAIVLDIHHPDAVIDSEALSRLPRDIVRVPLLRDVLTQDFVDYYETDTTRLSAEGALRRLAFEHELDWRDELVRRVFDEPAHVLLWRSPDGRLGYWLLSIHRNGLAKLLQGLGNVATSDTQLSQVAKLPGDVPVYALKLAVGRTLLFVAKDERLVVLSAPGVLLDDKGAVLGERADAVADMLSSGRDDAARAYRLDAAGDAVKGHRLVISANYLSFGYQAFFSGIDALRFDFATDSTTASAPNANAAASWKTWALIDPGKLPQQWNSTDLWHALPARPAACASLPADWHDASALLAKIIDGGAQGAAALGEQLAGPAAVCWYAKSTLLAPVFVARVKPLDATASAALKTTLGKTFSDSIGAYEAKAALHDGMTAGYRRLPVTMHQQGTDVTVWQRPVSARSGTALASKASFATELSAERYFPVTLALAHDYLIFSPDGGLVDDTLAVLGKRYPALADTLAPERLPRTILTLTPSSAAALIEREAGAALPADQEAVFRNAARTHLVPKLHALAHYPPVSLTLPQNLPSSTGWVPVEWWFERAQRAAGSTEGVAGALSGSDGLRAPDQPGAGDD